MELRPGYKRTEVGVIPEKWNLVRLKEVAETSSGTTPSRSLFDRYFTHGTHHWVKTLDLNNSVLSATDECVTDLALAETCLRIYPVGTVLIAMYGGFNQIGRTGLLRIAASVNQAITAVQPNSALFPAYLLATLNFRVDYWKSVASSSRKDPNITSQDIRGFPIPLPPIAEQRAIATALSDVDALLTQLDRLIAKKRDIKQATMQQLLTGKTRLPGFGGEWTTHSIGELGTTYGGLVGKSKADFGAGDAQYVTFLNVMSDTIINPAFFDRVRVPSGEPQNLVRRGDLLFNGSSETPEEVGMCALVACDCPSLYLNSFCFGLRLRNDAEVDGLFLAYLIRGEPGRNMMKSLAQGSTRYNISKAALRDASACLPGLQEQIIIASILSDLDAELAALEARRDKTRALKQGMMQALLTGRTRLI